MKSTEQWLTFDKAKARVIKELGKKLQFYHLADINRMTEAMLRGDKDWIAQGKAEGWPRMKSKIKKGGWA